MPEPGLAFLSSLFLGSLGPSSEDFLRREVRQITKAGNLFEMTGAGLPDDLKNYDAVIWGIESNPTEMLPGFFALKPQEEKVAVLIGRGKKAAIATDLFLRGGPKNGTDPTSFSRYLATLKGDELLHEEPVLPEEIERKGLESENKIDSTSMAGPLSKDAALRAARRCFECGACTLCGHCVNCCPDQSVRIDLSLKRIVFDYEFCKGCGICVFECPRGALGFAKEEVVWR